jgi:hypothetical protein
MLYRPARQPADFFSAGHWLPADLPAPLQGVDTMETLIFFAALFAILLFIEWQYSFLRRRVVVRIRPQATRRQVTDRRLH